MKIGQVTIERYRSVRKCDFEIKSGVLALVGGNESGKSNILFALEAFLSQRQFEDDDRYQLEEGEITIEATFDHFTNSETAKLKDFFDLDEIQTLRIKRTGNQYEIVEPIIPDHPSTPTTSPLPVAIVVEQPNLTTESSLEAQPDVEANEKVTAELEPTPAPSAPLSKEEITSDVLEILPRAQMIEGIEELIVGNNIDISDLTPLKGTSETQKKLTAYKIDVLKKFLLLGGITDDDLQMENIGRKNMILNRKAAKIAKLLRDSWRQEDIKIRFFAGPKTITINFRDGKNIQKEDDTKWIWTLPEKRSAGFRWYVTFYTKFLHGVTSSESNLFLVDDAAPPLNKLAQEDLLQEFQGIADSDDNLTNQIVYSTHSKYMVGWGYKEKIYVVEKAPGEGTCIDSNWWKPGKSIPSPLTDIGADESDFMGTANLVLEGVTDAMVFEHLYTVMKDVVNTSSPFGGYKVVPCAGIPSMISFGRMCKGHGKPEYLLFDSDNSGMAEKTNCDNNHHLKAQDLGTLAKNNINEYHIITIEDLLPQELFVEVVNQKGVAIFNSRWSKLNKARFTNGIMASINGREVTHGFTEREMKDFWNDNKYEIVYSTLEKIKDKSSYEDQRQLESTLNTLKSLTLELNQ